MTISNSYDKAILIAKVNNKRKTKCLKNHSCGLTQNPKNPKYRICLECKTLRNKSKWISKKVEIEKLENKKFKFFGV